MNSGESREVSELISSPIATSREIPLLDRFYPAGWGGSFSRWGVDSKGAIVAVDPEKRKKFPPICPDFAIELKSAPDSFKNSSGENVRNIENGASVVF